MIEEFTLALGTDHKMQVSGGKLPKCTKCNSDASPLFLGVETVEFPSEKYPNGLVRPVLWCRGCVNIYEPSGSQEHKVK